MYRQWKSVIMTDDIKLQGCSSYNIAVSMCIPGTLSFWTLQRNIYTFINQKESLLWLIWLLLTLCCWVMYKEMIAIPCVVDRLHISKLLYMSYTCVSQLFCHIYCVKVIKILKQEVWVSRYKHTDPVWFHILRTVHLKQGNNRFRYPVYFLLSLPSLEIKEVLGKNIFWRTYFVWVICEHIFWWLITVKLKF